MFIVDNGTFRVSLDLKGLHDRFIKLNEENRVWEVFIGDDSINNMTIISLLMNYELKLDPHMLAGQYRLIKRRWERLLRKFPVGRLS